MGDPAHLPVTWAVEVQHSSDFNQDGKWFELERTNDGNFAVDLWNFFFVKKPCHPTAGSYNGRPGRIRIVQ